MLQPVINQKIYAGGKKTKYHKCFANYKAMI